MGLHADIKPFLLVDHRSPPEETRGCCILTDDAMFNLHRFPASAQSTGQDLVAFFVAPISRFLLFPNTLAYILTFDSSFALLAKAETRQKRASHAPPCALETEEISETQLPHPYSAAICSAKHKYLLIEYIVKHILTHLGSTLVPEGKRLYIHASHRAHVITSSSIEDLGPQSTSLAEGDVASFYWLRQVAPTLLQPHTQRRTCFMRTLDSDSICVSLLTQASLVDVLELHLWLVKRGHDAFQPLCCISDSECADCLNVYNLVRFLHANQIQVSNFVVLLAGMGTDFTPKLFPGVGVKMLLEHGTTLLREKDAFSNEKEIQSFFTELVRKLPKKKTPAVCKPSDDVSLVCRRILWTIKYWSQEDPDPRQYGWST